MPDQPCSSNVGRKKYPIRNRTTREIFNNLVQWDNLEFSSDENNDQSDEESESESENGQDPNDDTQGSDNFSVNNNASSDSGDENDPVPALGPKGKQK